MEMNGWGGLPITMVNNSDIDVSWFCYNSYDDAKWVALGSGDLSANGGSSSYQPPKNSTGNYYVRFTRKGGGAELAGCATQGQEVTLVAAGGQYKASHT
jgi:hypothetical protein